MKWLNQVLLDIAITVLILLSTSEFVPWARWIVLVYTPFMLVIKAIAYFSPGLTQFSRQRKEETAAAPALFYHALYAINVAILGLYAWWITALQWVLIWLFSFLIERRGG